MNMTERQRKRIVENFKKEQGEVVAEFDYELLQNQIVQLQRAVEGLTDIVKADTQAMIRYETRLEGFSQRVASLESERDQLKELIRSMTDLNNNSIASVELWEVVKLLFEWTDPDESESDA